MQWWNGIWYPNSKNCVQSCPTCIEGHVVLGSGIRSRSQHYYLLVQVEPGIMISGSPCPGKLKTRCLQPSVNWCDSGAGINNPLIASLSPGLHKSKFKILVGSWDWDQQAANCWSWLWDLTGANSRPQWDPKTENKKQLIVAGWFKTLSPAARTVFFKDLGEVPDPVVPMRWRC